MTAENRTIHVDAEMSRARKLRAEARAMADGGMHARAASSLYFAALHAGRAILASIGVEPRSHRGLRTLLSMHFVKTGKLDPEVPRLFSDLQEAREGSDYVATYDVTPGEWQKLSEKADAILGEAERLVTAAEAL